MKRLFLFVSVVVLSLFSAQRALPSNITYTVNDTVGIGSVTGFIETDGTLGTLGNSDFINWNLTVYDGNGTASLLGPLSGDNSAVNTIGNVTATATVLEFNFNGDGNFFDIFDLATCSPPEWSFETTGSGAGCNATIGNEEGIAAVDPEGTGTYSAESGEVVFATATATSTVPEPAFSVVVLLLLGVGFIRIRTRNRALGSR